MTDEPQATLAEQIIANLTTSRDPAQLRKAELLRMRQAVLDLAITELGLSSPEVLPVVVELSQNQRDAMALVADYNGPNHFLLDLQRWLHVRGMLTQRQAEAALATFLIEGTE